MAFDRPRGLLGIDFEPEPLRGLEVWYRPPTVEAFAVVVEVGDYSPVESVTADNVIALRPLCQAFAGLLVSWNYEQRGVPVPVADYLALDALTTMRVAMTWARVSVGLPQEVPEVLELDIDPGEIPVETLAAG